MNRRKVWMTVGLIAVVAGLAALAGCGGGSSAPAVSSGITGVVVDAASNLGIVGMVVSAGGKSATSLAPNGTFTISGLAAGKYPLVVHPGTMFVGAPGPAPQVTVVQNQVTDVGTVFVVNRASLPPE